MQYHEQPSPPPNVSVQEKIHWENKASTACTTEASVTCYRYVTNPPPAFCRTSLGLSVMLLCPLFWVGSRFAPFVRSFVHSSVYWIFCYVTTTRRQVGLFSPVFIIGGLMGRIFGELALWMDIDIQFKVKTVVVEVDAKETKNRCA